MNDVIQTIWLVLFVDVTIWLPLCCVTVQAAVDTASIQTQSDLKILHNLTG